MRARPVTPPSAKTSVVWSASLFIVLVGAELATLGVAGIFAATPPAASTYFQYPSNMTYPYVGAGEVVSFSSPGPVVGTPSLTLNLVGGPPLCAMPGGPARPAPCPYAIIANCLNPGCQQLGGFFAKVTLSPTWGSVFVPPHARVFLVTFFCFCTHPALVVSLDWLGSFGIPTGLTSLGATFATACIGGIVLTSAAWPSWKRAGRTTSPLALGF
jgi:hypothetical protein